jgi:hypothetical protein
MPHDTLPVHSIVHPMALEKISSDVLELTISMTHVLLPLSFILITVREGHLALAMPVSLMPFTSVGFAIFVLHLAVSLRHSKTPFSLVLVAVRVNNHTDT